MTRIRAFILMLTLTLQAAGCHCCGVSERYGDRIDQFAETQCTLDCYYRPGLDLTRICRDCNTHGNRYGRPVPIYPESKVQSSPPAPPSDYSPQPTPAEPSSIPPIDASPLDVPAPPPPPETTIKFVPIMIQGDMEGISEEQLKEILKRAQSQVIQASGQSTKTTSNVQQLQTTITPRSKPAARTSSDTRKVERQRPISAPAGIAPSFNYTSLFEKLSDK